MCCAWGGGGGGFGDIAVTAPTHVLLAAKHCRFGRASQDNVRLLQISSFGTGDIIHLLQVSSLAALRPRPPPGHLSRFKSGAQ